MPSKSLVGNRPDGYGVIAPRRERPVQLAVPPIDTPTGRARGLKAHDIAGGMAMILAATTQGIVTPDKAFKHGQLVDTLLRAIETSEFDRRLRVSEHPDPTDP